MIAQWMFGALLFSALCGVAALATERALSALRRPTRLPWALALAIAACWPVIARLMLTSAPSVVVGVSTTIGMGSALAPLTTYEIAGLLPTISLAWHERLDATLLVMWGVMSSLLCFQVVMALRTLRRIARRAQIAHMNGERVLVDEALGPAVIGVVHPTIVIPAWLMGLDESLRALVLRHEREHCRASDPRLVWLSVVTTTLLPWNLALWWIARRLRLAMEIDCDARTLHRTADRTQYAKLLLLIAQQKSSARFVPLLSHSSSHLRRRISAMHSTPVRFSQLRAALAFGVAICAVAVACSSRMASNLTSPTPLVAPSSTPAVSTIDQPATHQPATATPPYFDFQVLTPAAMAPGSPGPVYPASLRAAGVSGTVLAQFVVNADGAIDTATFKAVRSTNADFTNAVRETLRTIRFTPAQKNGIAVRQLVQMPFSFGVADAKGGNATPAARTGDSASAQRSPRATSATPAPALPPNGAAANNRPYFDFQVERPATMRAGAAGPSYPPTLREAKVEGQVLTQFVVDASGRVDLSTLKVLKSDNDLFSEAVRAALAEMQFEPAILRGSPVKQLVQQPFQFSLNRN